MLIPSLRHIRADYPHSLSEIFLYGYDPSGNPFSPSCQMISSFADGVTCRLPLLQFTVIRDQRHEEADAFYDATPPVNGTYSAYCGGQSVMSITLYFRGSTVPEMDRVLRCDQKVWNRDMPHHKNTICMGRSCYLSARISGAPWLKDTLLRYSLCQSLHILPPTLRGSFQNSVNCEDVV